MRIRLWRPLSKRESGKPLASHLTTYVSTTLAIRLRSWIEETVAGGSDYDRVALRLDIEEALEDGNVLYDDGYVADDDLYDVIDAFLDLDDGDPSSLQEYLDDALSEYTVSEDKKSLVHRAEPLAAAAMIDSRSHAGGRADAGSASDHLAAAWAAAFALHPDTSKSYGESIRAIEAAAHAIVEPGNSLATLGTMIRYMRDHSADFRLVLPGPGVSADTATAMMSVLWKGQTSRHAGQTPTRKETVEEARAAVHLAVVLVQWFSCGIVRHIPSRSEAFRGSEAKPEAEREIV
jgi:hypothetical protein